MLSEKETYSEADANVVDSIIISTQSNNEATRFIKSPQTVIISQTNLCFANIKNRFYYIIATAFLQATMKIFCFCCFDNKVTALEKHGTDFNKLVEAKKDKIRNDSNAKTMSDEELTYLADAEVIADSCETMLKDSKIFEDIAQGNPTLAQKIKAKLKNFIERLKQLLKKTDALTYEGKLFEECISELENIQKLWDKAVTSGIKTTNAINAKQKNNTADNGVKYKLRNYSEKQLNNWSNSKNIIIYVSDNQLSDFVDKALASENLNQKLYFGIIDDKLANRIYSDTNVNVEGFNVVLRASEIRKILLYSHGNEVKETSRGQRAITKKDIMLIPKIISEPDKIVNAGFTKSDKPAIAFVKTIKGKTTVLSYVSDKHMNLTVQTMYSGKEKSLSTIADAKSPASTSKTNSGTAFNKRISQDNASVNNQANQENKKFSMRNSAYLEAVENNDLETAQRLVEEAAKESGYTIKAYHGTTNQQEKSIWNDKTKSYDTEYKKFTVFKRQYDEQVGHFFNDDVDNAGGYGSFLYSVYLKTNKPLVIDCNGQNYASIVFDGKEMDTYEWAKYAKRNGYDGIIFKNISDGVGYDDLSRLTTDYVVFNSNQIKSADSVTYDDNGNVIPLSERFNEAKSDIRYQARSSNSDYDFSKELTKTDYSDLTTLDDRERTVYNKRGWTCRLFSKEDRILLGEKFNELDNKITRKTDNVLEDGSKIVEVNNKIVLISGTFSEPEINCVLAINVANETEALGIKEAIFYEYPNYRKNKETLGDFLQYVQTYEEFVRTYRAEDFSYYKGQVDTGERATLPDNFKNYGYTKQFQDRTGSNSNAGQGVSDSRVNDNVDTSAALEESLQESDDYSKLFLITECCSQGFKKLAESSVEEEEIAQRAEERN